MKHPGPFRPEPRPPEFDLLSVIVPLVTMAFGVGIGLYCLHDGGRLGDELYVAAMAFVVAVPAGIIVAIDIERQARRDARARSNEVPPPFDIHLVWPPEPTPRPDGEDGGAPSGKPQWSGGRKP